MSEFKRLPERVDPRRLAIAGGSVEGEVELVALTRLADYLLAGEVPERGRATLNLVFEEDAQRRVLLTGRLRADLTLECQRCLGPVPWRVDQPLRLVAVDDETAAAQAPRDCDPVVVPADGLDPVALAEDELILALPLVARCDAADCAGAPGATARRTRGDNPFAVLARLKGNDDRSDG